MQKKLTTIGKSRALILPKELLELYGFAEEVTIEPTDGGLIIRPASRSMSFEAATAKLFEEKRDLLRRLSQV